VYIQRQTAYNAAGGVSSTLSGRRGGGRSGGQTKAEAEWSEFQAGIEANNMIISLHAEQVDRSNNILKQAGIAIDAGGVIAYAGNNLNDMKAEIKVSADSISQIVTAVGDNGEVTAASIVLAINDSGSEVTIDADHIKIGGTNSSIELGTVLYQNSDGYAEINAYRVDCVTAQATNVYANFIQAPGSSSAGTQLWITADQVQSKAFIYEKSGGGSTDLKNSFVSVTDGAYVNNSKTVTFTKADGNTETITFSRATTLTGAVDGSAHTLTVTATPQNENIKYIVTQTGSWSNNTYNGTINITEQGQATQAIRTFTLTGPGGVSSVTYLNGNGVPVNISNYGTIAVPFSGDNYGTTININNGEFAFNINGSHPATHNISFGATSTSVPSGYGSSPAKTVTAGTGSNHFYFTVTCGTSKKYVQINY
jgi:hypothetical protein